MIVPIAIEHLGHFIPNGLHLLQSQYVIHGSWKLLFLYIPAGEHILKKIAHHLSYHLRFHGSNDVSLGEEGRSELEINA